MVSRIEIYELEFKADFIYEAFLPAEYFYGTMYMFGSCGSKTEAQFDDLHISLMVHGHHQISNNLSPSALGRSYDLYLHNDRRKPIPIKVQISWTSRRQFTAREMIWSLSLGVLAVLLLGSTVQGSSDFTIKDKDTLAVALNLEYLEAEYFLFGAYGKGLDHFAPEIAENGLPVKGGEKAKLDPVVREVVEQFGLQEVGHVRAIKKALGSESFHRPELNIGKKVWAQVFDDAFGKKLDPPFDPYANSVNYMLSAYAIPYVGLTGYTGGAPLLQGAEAKSLAARLLAVEAGQDASIRTWLYLHKDEKVEPYDFTVAEATDKLSKLRNKLDGVDEVTDEGIVVPKKLGPEQAVEGNVIAGDKDSLAYTRTPRQIFSVVYATGDPSKPGGFYPKGGLGRHALKYLSTYESVKQTLNPFLDSDL